MIKGFYISIPLADPHRNIILFNYALVLRRIVRRCNYECSIVAKVSMTGTRQQKDFRNGQYRRGFKICRLCAVWMKVEGISCPCCGGKLRLGPRSKLGKERLKRS